MHASGAFLFLCTLPLCILGYTMFQDRLPNGGFVPHPCRPNYLWKGVGHEALAGAGARNPFGQDFADNGFKWDSCFCNQDSDGDGLTNGQELGDPDCIWTEGAAPTHKFGLSHPGVCEPLDDPECARRNTFEIDCSAPESFTCDAINNEDVSTIELKFPETAVAAEETTYMCMTYQLPTDQDYHIIAYEPMIDNVHVMHHMLVFGCEDDTEIDVAPERCDMGFSTCNEIIALWGVGTNGDCLPQEYGMAIGGHGFKKVALQMHWTNPAERTDYTDSSGMRVFYTPTLRPNSARVLQVGQYYLQIPPGKKQVAFDSVCSADCTSNLDTPIFVSDALFHMHYMGHSGYSQLWRDGQKVVDLVSTDDYDYDTPEIVRHYPAVEVKPGDEIRTRCVFNSLNRNTMTYFGEGSYDEMCIDFLIYYPAVDNFLMCNQWHDDQRCSLGNGTGRSPLDKECDTDAFFYEEDTTRLFGEIGQACDSTGRECLPGCAALVAELRQHPCMAGNTGVQIEGWFPHISEDMANLRNQLRSCEPYGVVLVDGEVDNNTEDQVQGPVRYDPDRNNLPVNGVCPWADEGDDATGGTTTTKGHMKVMFVMALLSFVALL